MDFNLIVIGSGAAGMIAAIRAARDSKTVLLIEKLPTLGAKLKATGGGRCNLSNTLPNEDFMKSFGREGRFMTQALNQFDHKDLMTFLKEIGVDTHIPDGFRIFPVTHSSSTILKALEDELYKLEVKILTDTRVTNLLIDKEQIRGVETPAEIFKSDAVIVATGGLGYPQLGSTGDGYAMAENLGHKITDLHPAMIPLEVEETWVQNCKADTIPKAIVKINIKKQNKLKAVGDLIFTQKGIRGPVVLDFAREITPLLKKFEKVPLLISLTKGMNENEILLHIKKQTSLHPNKTLLEHITTLVPKSVATEFLKISQIDLDASFNNIKGVSKNALVKMLCSTPLTVTGHDGFKKAMITRGGVNLKEINPNTMQSKIIQGLYFCGEVMNLDGPCGGYNLQWSFASGYLAGQLIPN